MSNSLVLFSGHSAFDSIGGMQQFNRRVAAGLSELAAGGGHIDPVILMLHDKADVRTVGNCRTEGFGGSQTAFARKFLQYALRSPALSLCGAVGLSHLCLALKLLRPSCPQILFAHGVEVWGSSHYRKMRPLEGMAIRRSIDRVAAVSRFTAERMSRVYGLDPAKFILFPNAIDTCVKQVGCKAFWKQAGRAPRLLSVGRLGPHERDKGFATVLRSLLLLRQHYPNLKYSVVGDGPLRSELEAMALDLKVDDMVEFTGRLSNSALSRKYCEADVFVLPSKKEGFGIVFLEAWQHGLPVVCGNSDASGEVVENERDGFTVDPDSPVELAAAIQKLLDDGELCREFAKCGYEKTQRRYSSKKFVANLKELIVGHAPVGISRSAEIRSSNR
jgi:glycosyltransferase involved in cell wall biosynthesis